MENGRFKIPAKHEIIIYGAGKTWAAQTLKWLRDVHGFNINSRWIDFEQVLATPESEHPPEVHSDENFKRSIWDDGCKPDCLECDMMILLANPVDGEKHSGSIAELGHVTAFNKPVYILGTCASFEPVGHSDRAFKSQSVVHYWPEFTGDNCKAGAEKAIFHYQGNYYHQWNMRRTRNRKLLNYPTLVHNLESV